ncbi:hypothetical protein ABK040_013180 [Willaertia magna]
MKIIIPKHDLLLKRKLIEIIKQESMQEELINKEKKNKLMEQFLIRDILYIISEYLDSINDFINLFQINKYVYFTILYNSEIIFQSKLFKNDDVTIYLDKKLLPNYLFQLQNLNINYGYRNDLNLLQNFTHLKYLKINCLEENFVFFSLPFLEELHISNTNLQQFTLQNLQQQLKTLTLDKCKLNDSCIDYLNNLQELTIKNCEKISGECLQNFTNLTKLKEKSFGENEDITDITKYVENLINLKYLNIYKNRDRQIKNTNFIKKLTSLEYLSIKVGKVIPEDFYNLQKLKYLKINHYDSSFTNLESLTELNYGCNCCSRSQKILLNFPKLKKLTLFDTEIEDDCLQNLNMLKELHIMRCPLVLGEFYLNNLEKLSVHGGSVVESFFKNLNNLKYLQVSGCQSLNPEFLQYLPKLESLELLYYSQVTDKYLQNLQNLKHLEINCPNVEELTIHLENSLFVIKYLNVLTNLNNLCIYTNRSHILKKGDYLLSMNKLNCFKSRGISCENKFKVDELKERIKKGEALEQIRNWQLN